MNAIWKYPLQGPSVTLEMPRGARILDLQTQHNVPTIWALVDPTEFKVRRTFHAVATGGEFSQAGLSYVGTFQINGGGLVFHIFEEFQ